MPTISHSNTKLGAIPNWSIPAIETCPGRTAECEKACYVGGDHGYNKHFPSTAVAYSKNLDDVLTSDDWKVSIIRYLSKKNPGMFRIHVSGDFFSRSYIQAWHDIISLFPNTQFLAFTRSWRVESMRSTLRQLAKLPNVQVIASCDSEASNAPADFRRAYMGEPEDADYHLNLLLGNRNRLVMCPGYGPKELQCDKCGLCFRPAAVDVWFPIH